MGWQGGQEVGGGGETRRHERSKEKCMFGVGSDLEASGLGSSDRPGTSEGEQERGGSRATSSAGAQCPLALWC